jgi:hypothetical protein
MKVYIVHQSLKDTGTAGTYGTYTSRNAAEKAISDAKGNPTFTAPQREATYYIEEREAEEFPARPPSDQEGKHTGGAQEAANTPVVGLTTNEEGEPMNVPNQQLSDSDEDPHSRHLRKRR